MMNDDKNTCLNESNQDDSTGFSRTFINFIIDMCMYDASYGYYLVFESLLSSQCYK